MYYNMDVHIYAHTHSRNAKRIIKRWEADLPFLTHNIFLGTHIPYF